MASISREPNGNRTIQFIAAGGKRQSIRLGDATQRAAESVKVHIERLVTASNSSYAVEPDTSLWLAEIGDRLHARLVKVGLTKPRLSVRAARGPTLGEWLDQYMKSRDDVKPSTRIALGNAERHLRALFDTNRLLASINPGDADEWRRYLKREGLADNTIRRRTGIARQIFRAAIRRRLLTENPFDGLPVTVRGNSSRDRFITVEESSRIFDACPDAEWRLIFALSRFGGFRCPSEHLALRWTDVDWERGRITVHSPKTEHHAGGESRTVPMFPELRSHLMTVFENAEPGTEFVITRYRSPQQNLRTQFNRIIRNAGMEPWPKLFQNLRATRETELMRRFPAHVVVEWIGHSLRVANEHYLQLTEEDWKAATDVATPKAVQNPVQQAHVLARKTSNETPGQPEETPFLTATRGNASGCDKNTDVGLGVAGLEQAGNSKGNSGDSDQSGAKSGAIAAQSAPHPSSPASSDPQLAALIAAWPRVPDALRAGIVAMVSAATL